MGQKIGKRIDVPVTMIRFSNLISGSAEPLPLRVDSIWITIVDSSAKTPPILLNVTGLRARGYYEEV